MLRRRRDTPQSRPQWRTHGTRVPCPTCHADASDLSLQVVSIDDFYFEAERLDQAMGGNPWGVPRALPGSHDLPLLLQTLSRWKDGEQVDLPQFILLEEIGSQYGLV